MTVRILVADDHPAFVSGLCTLLGAVPDVQVVQVVGTAATGDEAVAAAERHRTW